MTMNKILLAAIISFYTISYSLAQMPTFSNVDYVGRNIPRQNMDIYVPAGLTKPAPVIVFIHGGGWSVGSKGAANVPFFQKSYNAGFICADINYRLSGDSVWPAQIEDCKTAIRFLKANARTYNIDTCRFGVIGTSAGGHLCAMLGTTADVVDLEGRHLGYPNVSSRIQAVVDLFGPTDFLKMDGYYAVSCGTSGLLHERNSPETALLNINALSNYPALVATANPITYLTPDDAKFFIMHGGSDCTVPTYQSTLLDSNLAAKGIRADTFIVANGQGHGGAYYSDATRTALFHNFFMKHLSRPCTATETMETNISNLTVYPNPFTNQINIKNTKGYKNFMLINALGQTIYSGKNISAQDFSHLNNGIYFISITDSGKNVSPQYFKLLKQ